MKVVPAQGHEPKRLRASSGVLTNSLIWILFLESAGIGCEGIVELESDTRNNTRSPPQNGPKKVY